MGLKRIKINDEDDFARLMRRVFVLMWFAGLAALGFEQFVIEKGPIWIFIGTAIVTAILLAGTYLFFIDRAKLLFRQIRDAAIRRIQ